MPDVFGFAGLPRNRRRRDFVAENVSTSVNFVPVLTRVSFVVVHEPHTGADILEYVWSETHTHMHTYIHTRGSRISNWISFASAKLSIDLRCLFSSTSFVLPLGWNDREEEIWC